MHQFSGILIFVSLALFAQNPMDQDSARRMIKERNKQVLKAILDGDAQAYAGLYCPDGFKLSPGAAKIKGSINIFKSQKEIFEKVSVSSGNIETLDLDISGDMIWETGNFEYDLKVKEGKGSVRKVSGKYLVVWKRQPDGEWLIQADVGMPH